MYRSAVYIRTDITGYQPSPGDLAYPEKLEMMEVAFFYPKEMKKGFFM